MSKEAEVLLQQDSNTLNPNGIGWRPESPANEVVPSRTRERPASLPRDSELRGSASTPNAPSQPIAQRVSKNAKGVVGRVCGLERRNEMSDWTTAPLDVWMFRVIRYDEAENRLPVPPVVVEMRGRAFEGFLNENDKVHIPGNFKEGEIVRTDRVYNLTTGTRILAKDPLRKWTIVNWLIGLPVIGFFLIVFTLIVIGLILGAH